jgi:hypothetical protein
LDDRADADPGGDTIADTVQEVGADPNRGRLAIGAVPAYRDQTVGNVTHQRGRRPRVDGSKMHGEGVGEPLPLGDQPRVSQLSIKIRYCERQHHDRLIRQP